MSLPAQSSALDMATLQKTPINLFRGWPSPRLLPISNIRAASLEVLDDEDEAVAALLYGPDPGHAPLRRSIASWLSEFYASPDHVERICVTGGASQSLAAILEAYTDPCHTRRVWMICPTYFSACQIFVDAGLHKSLRAAPEDNEGVDVNYLEERMRECSQEPSTDDSSPVKLCHKNRKFYSQVIYAVPTFSNPSGKTMSLRRRHKLVQLARQYNALIISDDVYDFLQWSIHDNDDVTHTNTAVIPRLVDIDRQMGIEPDSDGFGHAISNGTFSKVVAPGCRTGWVEGTETFISGLSQLGTRVSGGSPSQLSAACISSLLRSGKLQAHISEVLQPAYKSRHHTMIMAAREYLQPLGVNVIQSDLEGISGGYFIWLRLPEPLQADEVAQECRANQNLILAPGTLFNVRGDEAIVDLTRYIRLCFSWEGEDMLREGVRRLAAVIESLV